MSRTYRNYEVNAHKYYRRPRGHVQAVLNNVRKRAIPQMRGMTIVFKESKGFPGKLREKC